jgi:hypothetical protein
MKRVVGVPRDFGQLDGLGNSIVVYVTVAVVRFAIKQAKPATGFGLT